MNFNNIGQRLFVALDLLLSIGCLLIGIDYFLRGNAPIPLPALIEPIAYAILTIWCTIELGHAVIYREETYQSLTGIDSPDETTEPTSYSVNDQWEQENL